MVLQARGAVRGGCAAEETLVGKGQHDVLDAHPDRRQGVQLEQGAAPTERLHGVADQQQLGSLQHHRLLQRKRAAIDLLELFLVDARKEALDLEIDHPSWITYWEAGAASEPRDLDIVGLTVRAEQDGSYAVAGVTTRDATPTVAGAEVGTCSSESGRLTRPVRLSAPWWTHCGALRVRRAPYSSSARASG
jgi:hypothetical protein